MTDTGGSIIPSFLLVEAAGPRGGNNAWVMGGDFSVDGLYPGDYTLLIRYFGKNVYWNSEGGTFDEGAAEPVHVEADQQVTGIHFALLPLGAITGRITDYTGNPVSGAQLIASNEAGQERGGGRSGRTGSIGFEPPRRHAPSAQSIRSMTRSIGPPRVAHLTR